MVNISISIKRKISRKNISQKYHLIIEEKYWTYFQTRIEPQFCFWQGSDKTLKAINFFQLYSPPFDYHGRYKQSVVLMNNENK